MNGSHDVQSRRSKRVKKSFKALLCSLEKTLTRNRKLESSSVGNKDGGSDAKFVREIVCLYDASDISIDADRTRPLIMICDWILPNREAL